MKDYRIDLSSDLDYEKMVVDILYLNNLVIKLSSDKGIEKTKAEIFDKYTGNVIWELDFHRFISILEEGFQKLRKVNE